MSSKEPSSGVGTEDVTRELQSRGVRVHTKGPAVDETMVGRAVEAARGAGFFFYHHQLQFWEIIFNFQIFFF